MIATLALLLALAGDAPSAPADKPFVIDWDSPGCGSAARLEDAVEHMVRAPSLIGVGKVHAKIRKERDGAWRLELRTEVGEKQGLRILSHQECEALIDAAALVLAWILEVRAQEMSAAQKPVSPSASAVPPPAPTPLAPAPSPIRYTVGLHGLVAGGLLPGPVWGGGVSFAFGRRWVDLVASASAFASRDVVLAENPSVGARMSLWDLSLSACASPMSTARLSVRGCLGFCEARVSGESTGVYAPGSASAWQSGLLGALSVRLRISERFAVRASGEGRLLLRRATFAIEGAGDIFRPDWMHRQASLGLEASF